jgi:CRISPR-associated protein Cas5d
MHPGYSSNPPIVERTLMTETLNHQLHTLRVWGDRACFSEPALHTERYSYPIITPSAARGIFEAIFWKPQFAWKITEIAVIKRGYRSSIFRNEIAIRQNEKSFSTDSVLDVTQNREQRHSSILNDVEYLLTAQIVTSGNQKKYHDMFLQRATRGKCVWQPYLGCREFSAYFEYVAKDDKTTIPLDTWNADLGYIILDLEHSNDKTKAPSGTEFFRATVTNGIMAVEDTPQWLLNKAQGG